MENKMSVGRKELGIWKRLLKNNFFFYLKQFFIFVSKNKNL